MIEQTPHGIRITVFAQPKASKNEVIGPHNGAIKIKITAPPIEGRANEAIIEFFSDLFKIPKRNIQLYRGGTSRNKIFQLEGVTLEEARAVLKLTT